MYVRELELFLTVMLRRYTGGSSARKTLRRSGVQLPLRAKVVLGKHSIFTHFPKDPNCDICLKTKIPRASCRRRVGTIVPKAEKLGDLIKRDHKILSEESESRNNHRYAVVVQDLVTQWLHSYLCKTKNFPGDPEELDEVLGSDEETKSHLH